MLKRILKALSVNYENEQVGHIWEFCNSHITKVKMTKSNLDNMCVNNLTYGFFSGNNDPAEKETLVMLDHALGINGIRNPEGYNHIPPIYPQTSCRDVSNSDILKGIEEKLNFPISFPLFSGGIKSTDSTYGMFSVRHLHYLWVTKRLLELCPDRNSRIIEIGPGIGLLGYYLDKLGYRDYTVIDLAHQNACQAYFLSKNLPYRDFILSQEVNNPFDESYKDSIKILHTNDFIHSVPANRYDIMINIDGLTEFPIEDAKRYVHNTCAPMLLSINHEINLFRVIQIAEPFKHLVYRYPFWLREGYVEELFSI
jgi:hypothetical protein